MKARLKADIERLARDLEEQTCHPIDRNVVRCSMMKAMPRQSLLLLETGQLPALPD
jgi:hypothetical protein